MEWADDWLDALDLPRATEARYRSLITNNILPRWGETSLADITGLAVAARPKQLAAGYTPAATTTTIVKVLSMVLADAADGVSEITQAARLGRTLEDKMQKVYSHIAAEVEQRLLTGLQDRWGSRRRLDHAGTTNPLAPRLIARWRSSSSAGAEVDAHRARRRSDAAGSRPL